MYEPQLEVECNGLTLIVDMGYFSVKKARVELVEMSEEDGCYVTRWRNTDQARKWFYSDKVVTPDSHVKFLREKDPNDIIWTIKSADDSRPIGMLSMKINPDNHTGEYGRFLIDQIYQGKKFGEEAEYLLLTYMFDVLNLKTVWLEAFADNDPITKLHLKTGFIITGYIDHDGRSVAVYKYFKDRWNVLGRNAFISFLEKEK